MSTDLSQMSMQDLFRLDAESQIQSLTDELLALERDATAPKHLEACMRAAHSLKGAARIIGLNVGVKVSHVMEDCFVAAQRGTLVLQQTHIDVLLQGVDLLNRIANTAEADVPSWAGEKQAEVNAFLAALQSVVESGPGPAAASVTTAPPARKLSFSEQLQAEAAAQAGAVSETPAAQDKNLPSPQPSPADAGEGATPLLDCPLPHQRERVRVRAAGVEDTSESSTPEMRTVNENNSAPVISEVTVSESVPAAAPTKPAFTERRGDANERVLRVSAENLNRLLGLASESLVESRWLKSYSESTLRLKRMHASNLRSFNHLLEGLDAQEDRSTLKDSIKDALVDIYTHMQGVHQLIAERLTEVELFDSRSANLARRLYDSVLSCRMRPFADGIGAFPRMVRDVSRLLGKQVCLEVIGESTQVDRDILEKLDAPLGHLLRNAIDHGLEMPDERIAAGKPAEGVVRLEARHSAGQLQISLSDDGRGMNMPHLRKVIVERKYTTEEQVDKMSEAELLEFLFLPGFSLKEGVTEISGRGVGLDVVQDMLKQVRGTIRVTSQIGKGMRFLMQLPLTLSVIRTLLVDIGGEAYAFPLAHVVRTLKLPRDQIHHLEGRQYFDLDGRSIGLVAAHQIIGGTPTSGMGDLLPVLIVGGADNTYGIVIDAFLGERELVVQPLDTRLGKIKDIAAGALMEDGSPVLIVDIDDLLRSIEKLVQAGNLNKVEGGSNAKVARQKRVLVVDDSLTVRELERKLLDIAGYAVEVAVDGMDGWNVVRTGQFDLVISDVDMPRMDGIELVTLIKKDPNLKSMPVMIVSYKDREEDRQRGLEAGADYYLTKGSFHDETLLDAVIDLIGAAHG